MPSTLTVALILGDFEFLDNEVPENIPFGGSQKLQEHVLVGGDRLIDSMGWQPKPLAWSGIFFGNRDDVMNRVLYLQTLANQGNELTLTWSELNYQVKIESFEPVMNREYYIPYSISCKVIKDNTQPVTDFTVPGIDDVISGDMATSSGLVDLIGDSTLSSLFGTLSSAVSAVSTFTNLATSVMNSVLLPLNAVQKQCSSLLASSSNAINALGFPASNKALQALNNITSQASALNQTNNLFNLTGTLGRISSNISSVYSSAKTLSTAGANLYTVATQQYGDATAWTGIARANNLTDPVVSGVTTITIPPIPDTSGGIAID